MTSKKVEKRIVFAVKGMRSIPVINFKKAVSIIVLFSFILCSCGNKSPLGRGCKKCPEWERDPNENEAEKKECLEKERKLLVSLVDEYEKRKELEKTCNSSYTTCLKKTNCSMNGKCSEEDEDPFLEDCMLKQKCLSDKDVEKCYNALLVCRQDANMLSIEMIGRLENAKSKCSGTGNILGKIKLSKDTFVGEKKTLSTYTQCCRDKRLTPWGLEKNKGQCVEPKIAACSNIVPGDDSDPKASRCCFEDLYGKSKCVDVKEHSCYFDPVEYGVAVVKKAVNKRIFGEKYLEYIYDAEIQALAQKVLDLDKNLGDKDETLETKKKAEEIVEKKFKPIKIVGGYNFKIDVLSSDVPVLVVFWKPRHRKELASVINELASEYEGRAKICTINIYESVNNDLLEELKKNGVKIEQVQTLFMYKNREFKKIKIEGSISIDALRGIIDKQV